jgi:neutral ceramidase
MEGQGDFMAKSKHSVNAAKAVADANSTVTPQAIPRPKANGCVLRAGVAKIDITPHEPVHLCGYQLRKEPAQRTHGKIWARALAFDDGERQFVLMVADLIVMDYDDLTRRIVEGTGVDPNSLYVGDIHNHAAPTSRPRPTGAPPTYPGNDHTQWFKDFPRAAVQVVREALAALQPVKLGVGTGRSRVGMNRRKRMADVESAVTFDENNSSQSFGEHQTDRPVMLREFDNVVRLGANPLGPIDDEVGVLRLDTLDGRPLAVVMNYACHGTSLGGRNDVICGDWIGHAMDAMEGRLGALPIFLQGAAGDINPRIVGGLDGHADSLEATALLGDEFARDVIRAYGEIKADVPAEPAIRVAHANIQLPRAYRELFQDFRQTAVDVPTIAVRLGDVTWVNFPGEMFHQIGQQVKRAAPTPIAFLASGTNGYIGYFPTQAAFSEGGYEPAASHLDPAAEQHYLKQIARLLAQLR